jgi:hypothetical protein
MKRTAEAAERDGGIDECGPGDAWKKKNTTMKTTGDDGRRDVGSMKININFFTIIYTLSPR